MKKSPSAGNVLRAQQNTMGRKVLSLIQECSTGWRSILNMICRILENQESYTATLEQKGKDHILSTSKL